jgi:hypothetical protein
MIVPVSHQLKTFLFLCCILLQYAQGVEKFVFDLKTDYFLFFSRARNCHPANSALVTDSSSCNRHLYIAALVSALQAL